MQVMDKDGNGKLDTGEFRDAMQQLGGSLSGDSVATIFDAMGINGYITLDQFLDIVEVCVHASACLHACTRVSGRAAQNTVAMRVAATCTGSQGTADAWQLLLPNCLGNSWQLAWLPAAAMIWSGSKLLSCRMS